VLQAMPEAHKDHFNPIVGAGILHRFGFRQSFWAAGDNPADQTLPVLIRARLKTL
jgi:hypothetical protein